MARFIEQHFLPARVHVRDQAAEFKRLGEKYEAQWTPTILLLDPQGEEQHRIEGFLPADEFQAQLMLGLGHAAFHHHQWAQAEKWFRQVVEQFEDSDSAPEALYWAGVARYKCSGDGSALADTARAFRDRWGDTSWAKKASVWGAHPA